jgi:hypothetical protein
MLGLVSAPYYLCAMLSAACVPVKKGLHTMPAVNALSSWRKHERQGMQEPAWLVRAGS